jgi:hypothetical protein
MTRLEPRRTYDPTLQMLPIPAVQHPEDFDACCF